MATKGKCFPPDSAKLEAKAIRKEKPVASTYIERESRKLEKQHALCGRAVRFDYLVFERKDRKAVCVGIVERTAKIYAVRMDMCEIICTDNAESVYIPVNLLKYDI